MAARRNVDRAEGSEPAFAAGGASTQVPADSLEAARGIGWGLVLAILGFWLPTLALWRWLHR